MGKGGKLKTTSATLVAAESDKELFFYDVPWHLIAASALNISSVNQLFEYSWYFLYIYNYADLTKYLAFWFLKIVLNYEHNKTSV